MGRKLHPIKIWDPRNGVLVVYGPRRALGPVWGPFLFGAHLGLIWGPFGLYLGPIWHIFGPFWPMGLAHGLFWPILAYFALKDTRWAVE